LLAADPDLELPTPGHHLGCRREVVEQVLDELASRRRRAEAMRPAFGPAHRRRIHDTPRDLDCLRRQPAEPIANAEALAERRGDRLRLLREPNLIDLEPLAGDAAAIAEAMTRRLGHVVTVLDDLATGLGARLRGRGRGEQR
jgi:hypothetical protein